MKTLFTALFFALAFAAPAQQQDPVSWTATYKKVNDKEGEILVTGIIQKGWHTYSQRPTDAGPVPTTVAFVPSKDYSLSGKLVENGAKEEFDAAFEAKLFVFHEKAEFKQKISIKNKSDFIVPVTVEYMSCNDMMCLPPKTASLQVQVQN